MSPKLVRAFTVIALAVGAVTIVQAQQNTPGSQGADVGNYEYEAHCAICHGSNGKGLDREPYWSFLTKDIPDLTTLASVRGLFRN